MKGCVLCQWLCKQKGDCGTCAFCIEGESHTGYERLCPNHSPLVKILFHYKLVLIVLNTNCFFLIYLGIIWSYHQIDKKIDGFADIISYPFRVFWINADVISFNVHKTWYLLLILGMFIYPSTSSSCILVVYTELGNRLPVVAFLINTLLKYACVCWRDK